MAKATEWSATEEEEEEGSDLRPLVEGSGGYGINKAIGNAAMIKLTIGARRNKVPSLTPEEENSPDQIVEYRYYAYTEGVAAGAKVNGKYAPYVDVKFSPIMDEKKWINPDTGVNKNRLTRWTPVNVVRNFNLDQELVVKASVIGVTLGVDQDISEKVIVFAQLAADAVGAKYAKYLSESSSFKGVHLGKLNAEAGFTYAFDTDFTVRFSVGGEADMNWNASFAKGRYQADMQAFATLKADVWRFISVFARASWGAMWDSGNDKFVHGPQALVGLNIVFY